MRPLNIFCLDWPTTISSATELVATPLRDLANVSVTPWDRAAASLGDVRALAAAGPAVFCQAPPPRQLAESPGARIVWVPMWDELRMYTDAAWAELPRTVRVVAFSRAVAERTAARGFPTLRLQYFLDPTRVESASFAGGPILFYWNRTGLYSSGFLARICRSLKATTLLFRGRLDPGVSPEGGLWLPFRLGGATVVEIPAALPRDQYLRLISSANVFLSPRACEGVGLMLLEAMARGQTAIACDAPAMNEYITNGEDGVLLRVASTLNGTDGLSSRSRWLVPHHAIERPNADLAPAARQDWEALAATDLRGLGRRARERHEAGFEAWRRRLPELAHFVLDW